MTTQPKPTHDELAKRAKPIYDAAKPTGQDEFDELRRLVCTCNGPGALVDWRGYRHGSPCDRLVTSITNLYNAKFERAVGTFEYTSAATDHEAGYNTGWKERAEAARHTWYSDQKEGK